MNTQDRTTVHIVVIFLGVIATILAGGMLVLNLNSLHIDPVLSTTGAAALGSLATLLASTRGVAKDGTTPVTVQNAAPIPVTDSHTSDHPQSGTEVVGADLPATDLTGA